MLISGSIVEQRELRNSRAYQRRGIQETLQGAAHEARISNAGKARPADGQLPGGSKHWIGLGQPAPCVRVLTVLP